MSPDTSVGTGLPSLAYVFPERLFLGTGPELIAGNDGRVFMRQHRDFIQLAYSPSVLRETLRRATKLLNDPERFDGWQPPWWVGVGTALGMVREKGFLPNETDIDVRIGLHYHSNRQACADALKVVRCLYRHEFLPIREVYFDGRPMQVAFYDQANHHALLDVYFFYSGVSEGHYVNVNTATLRRKPEAFVENRRAVAWPGYQNLKVNVPWPVEDYLAWRFGPEWRIPKRRKELGPLDNACLEPIPRVSVLTYGTWDLFHAGHVNLLRRAAEMGDHLVVGVVSDELCTTKGKSPLQNEQQRAAPLRDLPFVNEVFIQRKLDQKEFDIERFGISHLVVGDDWLNHPRFEQVRGYRGVQLHYLPRTPGISSTQLRAAHQAGPVS